MREAALAKAGVLAEALPWLERWRGATVVLKYGGSDTHCTQISTGALAVSGASA